jgi:starvation-inducible outer membrane lipoprotein
MKEFNMKKICLIPLMCMGLAGCFEKPATSDPNADQKLSNGEVVKAAQAPDGTILWEVLIDGGTVYFASNHVSYAERSGKTTFERQVPTSYQSIPQSCLHEP